MLKFLSETVLPYSIGTRVKPRLQRGALCVEPVQSIQRRHFYDFLDVGQFLQFLNSMAKVSLSQIFPSLIVSYAEKFADLKMQQKVTIS